MKAKLCIACLMAMRMGAAWSAQAGEPALQSQEQSYKIAGRVVNAITNAELARVEVSVEETRNPSKKITAETGENGQFEFAGLPPGKYELKGSRRGYIASSYEQHGQFSTAVVTGADFATDNLTLRLIPMAMIAGHVLDESGEPVRQANVQLFAEDDSEGTRQITLTQSALSDDRGYFDMGGLRPGTYYVAVDAQPWYAVHPVTARPGIIPAQDIAPALDVTYPTTYYGGATDSAAAAPIEIHGGEVREIEIQLVPVPAMHLLVHVETRPAKGSREYRFPLIWKREFDSTRPVSGSGTSVSSQGVVEFFGLPPGRYDVVLSGTNASQAQSLGEVDLQHDGQELEKTEPLDMGKLKVSVKLPENEPMPNDYSLTLRDATWHQAEFAKGKADGLVTFDSVQPGKYSLEFTAPGGNYTVARTISPAGLTMGPEVNVSGGAQELTAEVRAGLVQVEGMAQRNGVPASGVMVALVPKDTERHMDMLRREQTSLDGSFTLEGVVPGSYTLVAVEDAWAVDWMKAAVRERYLNTGRTVVVGEKARGVMKLPEQVEVQAR
jgi:5-hydroxyisourate hydrolase-like protein (transthyretin family)